MHTQILTLDDPREAPPSQALPVPSLAARIGVFSYGLFSYLVFLGVYLYAAGFVTNLVVPKSIDAARNVPIGAAIVVNLALLGLFAVQHSGMARPAFKRWLTRVVPHPMERSTYCLASSAALIILFLFWQPMGGVIWDVQIPEARAALWTIGAAGWLIVLISTFLINHFDLFGLRQVWLYLLGKPYTRLRFQTPLFYRWVRHPLYLGWLMAFWATPSMTAAHLTFAVATTAYILVAIQFEERDLIRELGVDYVTYRKRVPMIFPFPRKNRAA